MLNLPTDQCNTGKQAKLTALHKHDQDDYYNIKLYNRDSDLVAINEAAKLIGRSLSPEFTIHSLLRMMSQMLGLNRGRVLLPDEDTISIKYSYGLTPEQQQRGVYMQGEGITGKVMAANQLVVIENIDEEPELLFRAVDRQSLPHETVSYIALPIMDGSHSVGVLACHRIRSRMRPFDADLVILRTFAAFIGQILKIHKGTDDLGSKPAADTQNDGQQRAGGKSQLIGISPAIVGTQEQAARVAKTNATVLLSGESGTGKERFAQVIHDSSAREDKAFIAINCAAIPEQLLEAELFGHERGAFTGAVSKKKGKFELADGGTLFLDEIGDLDIDLQTKLLRVLETQRVQRVGGIKEIPINVRIIAATHKDLISAVNEGRFRLDLFYRLNVFPLQLPPLRQRTEDIPLLTKHFLKKAKSEFKQHIIIDNGVMERLTHYEWPGNIRQLENIIQRAVLLNQDGKITPALIDHILALESKINLQGNEATYTLPETSNCRDIPTKKPIDDLVDNTEQKQASDYSTRTFQDSSTRRAYSWVDTAEIADMQAALKQARGNKTRAAELMGMSPRQFRYRFAKLGLDL